jgi:hypothetical protein
MSAAAAPPPPKPANQEIKIYSHSKLFYWWPVWLISFIMGFWSLMDGHKAAVVPSDSEVVPLGDGKAAVVPRGTMVIDKADVSYKEGAAEKPASKSARAVAVFEPDIKPAGASEELKLHMSSNKNLGVLFVIVLLLVIVITNVPMRGMWSVVIILSIVLLSIIFWLARINEKTIWEHIINFFHFLDVRINAAGYFVIGVVLFAIWLLNLLVFDRYIYVIFTPGQIKVCSEIGGGEQVYDTTGLSLEKQRSDLFRHILLGMGSGDLIVKTSGAQMHHWEFDNVLFIGTKVSAIEEMLKKKAVVATR